MPVSLVTVPDDSILQQNQRGEASFLIGTKDDGLSGRMLAHSVHALVRRLESAAPVTDSFRFRLRRSADDRLDALRVIHSFTATTSPRSTTRPSLCDRVLTPEIDSLAIDNSISAPRIDAAEVAKKMRRRKAPGRSFPTSR